jgi:hypothetical protein
MIDFRYVIPVRLYEQYNNSVRETTTPAGTTFKYINYLDAHYYETQQSKNTMHLNNYSTISSDEYIYEPYNFKETLSKNIPALKSNESHELYLSNDNVIPYLYFTDGDDKQIEKFLNPYKMSNVYDDNCIFKISEINDFPYISVSWCKYSTGTNEHIQLDFNSFYNKSNNDMLSINTYN